MSEADTGMDDVLTLQQQWHVQGFGIASTVWISLT
jgi:hypothetical protein